MDRLRRRAARQRGLRRRPPAGRRHAGRLVGRLQPGLPVRGPSAAPRVRWRRGDVRHRYRLARLRLADARGHRRRHHRRPALPARADPLPTAVDRGAGRPVRPRRRDVLRPVTDRDERRLCRAVHRRRLHGLRGRLDGLVARPGGLLDSDAGDRRPARPGAREQVGGGLCHRRPAAADPPAQCAGARHRDHGPDRHHRRARLHGHQRPGDLWRPGSGSRQPDLPDHHGRPDAAGRGGRRHPSDRLDRRRAALRGGCAGRPRRPRLLRSSRRRPARRPDRHRLGGDHPVAGRPGARPELAGDRRDLLARRSLGVRAARSATRRRRPDPVARPAGRRGRGLAPTGLAGGPARRLDGRLAARPAGRGLRDQLHPLGAHGQQPARARLAGRPHRADPARPDRLDVPLPQRAVGGASGLVAVVGVADEPQAGLVLPGGPRRRHGGSAV